MLALHLTRSSCCRYSNHKNLLKLDQTLLKAITNTSVNDRFYSNLTQKNAFTTARFNVSHQSARCLQIPPRNKHEFNDFMDAFKKELSKFKFEDLKKSPSVHLAYGAGGLAPFVLPPVQMLMFGFTDGMAWFQLAYAATILSYLGGIQWGATLPDASKPLPSYETLGLAVAPQLAAWVSLLLPVPLALITTSTALTATLAVDLLKQNYPPWFKSLRIFLTLGSVGSLAATLVGYIAA